MRQGKIIGLIAAWGLMSMQPAGAMTIGEIIESLGDQSALQILCTTIRAAESAERTIEFLEGNGLDAALILSGGSYNTDWKLATNRAMQRRKSMSITENCEEAVRMYGPNGTITKGIFKEAANAASD